MSSAFNGGALGSQASQELAGDLSLFKVSKHFGSLNIFHSLRCNLPIANIPFFF